jgi:hypothetical protein
VRQPLESQIDQELERTEQRKTPGDDRDNLKDT